MRTDDMTNYGANTDVATDSRTEIVFGDNSNVNEPVKETQKTVCDEALQEKAVSDASTGNDETVKVVNNSSKQAATPAARPVERPAASSGAGVGAGIAAGVIAGAATGAAGAFASSRIFDAAKTSIPEPLVDEDDIKSHSDVVEKEDVVQGGVEAVPVASSVSDDMSFSEAFAAARTEVGAGGVFEWKGNLYNTYYKEEWNAMSEAEKDAFFDNISSEPAETLAENEQIAVTDPQDEPIVAYLDESDPDVRIIGVYEGNIEGQDVYVGEVEMEGENVMFIDSDQDGFFDLAVADIDHDGTISDMEIADLTGAGISVEDLAMQSMMDVDDDLLASNNMPDYMNDADVSMC